MGLDMYLSAHKYVGNWNLDNHEEKDQYAVITKAVGLEGFVCEGSPHLTVAVTVAYWRKANAIHLWFVDNIQDGHDDCQESYVSREQLEELRDLCYKAIANKDPDVLPPTDGFFFEGTEIDEYYWQDLKETAAIIDRLLADERFKDWDFHYRASW